MSARAPDASWPRERLGEAIVELARSRGLSLRATSSPAPPPEGELDEWLVSAARFAGVEAQPLTLSKAEMPKFLCSGAPAILALERGRFLLVTSLISISRVSSSRSASSRCCPRSVRGVSNSSPSYSVRAFWWRYSAVSPASSSLAP